MCIRAPIKPDGEPPFSPRLVPQIIGLSEKWAIAGTPVTTRAVAFSGASGGSDLAQVLWHPDRAIPVIVVSDHNGLLLAPGIHDALAQELSGVALVARTDTDASWQLTALRGAAWSCYNGALRMYYPRLDSSADPRRHPLWTQRLYDQTAEELDDSARRLRSLLRRLALSFSAFSTYEPRPLTQLRAALDNAQRKRPTSPPPADPGWEAVATSYADDNVRLQADNAKLRSEVDDLRVQLANLQSAIAWRERAQEGDPAPAGAVPPATVEQAVQTARAQYGEDLLFGRSVETGIAGVAPDSGPPEKILNYLGILAQLAQARRIGPLGQNMVTWVEGKGATCSGESETILNSKEECRRRTWDDGTGAPRFFEMHLKPSDATSPDRCVRIYFEYDEVRKKVLIGWLGRKPGL